MINHRWEFTYSNDKNLIIVKQGPEKCELKCSVMEILAVKDKHWKTLSKSKMTCDMASKVGLFYLAYVLIERN